MRQTITLAALLALTACTTAEISYPSLLPRPIEHIDDAEPVRPNPVVAPDAALDRQIAEQRVLADTAATRFQATAGIAEARVAVARGVAPGGAGWIAAQSALADLAPIRGEIVQIVSQLEALAIARGEAGDLPYPALDAAIAHVDGLATKQAEQINAMEDALNR